MTKTKTGMRIILNRAMLETKKVGSIDDFAILRKVFLIYLTQKRQDLD
jgi:hypothetical protein